MFSMPYCSMPALTDCGMAAMCTGQPCWSWAISRPSRSKTPVERSLPSLKITECAVFSMVIVTSSQTWMKPLRITSRVTASMLSVRRCSTVAMSDHLLGEPASVAAAPVPCWSRSAGCPCESMSTLIPDATQTVEPSSSRIAGPGRRRPGRELVAVVDVDGAPLVAFEHRRASRSGSAPSLPAVWARRLVLGERARRDDAQAHHLGDPAVAGGSCRSPRRCARSGRSSARAPPP